MPTAADAPEGKFSACREKKRDKSAVNSSRVRRGVLRIANVHDRSLVLVHDFLFHRQARGLAVFDDKAELAEQGHQVVGGGR